MNAPHRWFCWWSGSIFLLGLAHAEPPRTRAFDAGSASTDAAGPTGIFNTDLLDLLTPENLRLSLRPHFGDFVRHDHFRLTIGARYGLTEHWELSTEADSYFAHGLGDVPFGDKYGFARMQFGAKYKFPVREEAFWQITAGVRYGFPVSRPPPELTDEFRRLTPYVTLTHPWESRPDLTSFTTFAVNFLDRARPAGNTDEDSFGLDHWSVTPGVVWRRETLKYTFAATLSSTAGLADRELHQVTLKPSLEWTLPPRFKFNSRNRWVVGLGLKAGAGDLGTDVGATVRIQTDFDFRRFFQRAPATSPKP